MHEHNYQGCDHNLRYCGHCDIVWCVKCRREWGRYWYSYTYPYYSPWGYTYGGSASLSVDPTASGITSLSTQHKHEEVK